MARVTDKQVAQLRKFLVGQQPSSTGEWYMRCPYHNDKTRSASLNMETGKWYCHACAIGGGINQLIAMGSPDGEGADTPFDYDEVEEEKASISIGEVAGYEAAFWDDRKAHRKLMRRRGLDEDILEEYRIGWDAGQDAYTIPIFNAEGEVINIRRYQIDPPDDRRKIWSVKGHGSPDLYPIDQLEHDVLVICEGEWDALATIQAGFHAITRTGAAKVWKSKWNHWFKDKIVYICHDRDQAGVFGNKLVYNELRKVARECYIIELPYEYQEKHGKDLSDYWEDYDAEDFRQLLADQSKQEDPEAEDSDRIPEVSIDESLQDDLLGQRVRMKVTVSGKSQDFVVPHEIEAHCGINMGQKCELCPMSDLGGEMSFTIAPDDRTILKVVGNPDEQLQKELIRTSGIFPGCKVVEFDFLSHHRVSDYGVRANVDDFDEERSTHTTRTITVVSGMGASMLNSTVEVEGVVYAHPKTQKNTLLADRVRKLETSIDRFELTDEVYERLVKFQSDKPLDKLFEIAEDLSANVTRIYQRPDMHVFIDLVFHSVISWYFNNQLENKGWLDALIIGDSRTGKSEAADRMRGHYRVGQMVTGENTTFAGLVGGLEQMFEKSWGVNWGIIPLNDRRMVILDEVSSLTVEELGRMSGIRTSGKAEITKIKSSQTSARTRMLWLSNPREGHRLSHYHYAFEAINILMGQREDVARFDLAMAVTNTDVPAEAINVMNQSTEPIYDSQSCHELLGWVWSRTADQIRWEPGAEELITLELAGKMAGLYSEDPAPLVQSANVRMKIARIAVAMAARTFSHHPDDDEILYVTKAHARAAAKFLHMVYSKTSFGYLAASKFQRKQQKRAQRHIEAMEKALESNETMLRFLTTRQSTFEAKHYRELAEVGDTFPDLESMVNWGMIDQTKNAYRVSDALRAILRSMY